MLALWNPFSLQTKKDKLFNLFDNMFDNHYFNSYGLDYKKTEDGSFILTVDLPGVKEEDINIEVSDNILTVKGNRKTATSSYSVQKSLTIPEDCDSNSIKAELFNGVLTLTIIPKALPQKEIKKIEINKK
jgi:HSP20 family protein